jgi:DNA-binding CsgD family transcriptional regulator
VPDEADAAAVADICRRLDGMPLALELAAARTKVLNPDDLLARLERKLHLLTGGRTDSPARQRTMRDAIAWSYGFLDDGHQALFRRLAVFRGGFSVAVAEEIFGDGAVPVDILDGLEQLVDQSLLARDERAAGESRLLMLETIREFGLEQIALHGEETAVYGGIAAYWRTLAEATWEDAQNLESLNRSLDLLETNHDSIRAALDWLEAKDPAAAIDLAGALFWLWYVHGHHAEALHRLKKLLAAPPQDAPIRALARALVAAAAFAQFQIRHDEAKRYAEEALTRWRTLNDPWGIGFSLVILGLIAEDAGDYHRARSLFDEAIGYLETANDTAMVASARYHLATVAFGLGRLDEAEAILSSVLDGGGASALRISAWAVHLRGLLAHTQGNEPAAFAYVQEGLRRFLEIKSPAGYGESLAGTAVVLASLGDPAAARFWGAATRLNLDRGETFNSPEMDVYQAAMGRLAGLIGTEAFAAEEAIGNGWAIDEAIRAALSLQPDFAGRGRATAKGKPVPPVGISPREAEVLRLVMEGRTNDQIADALFLSPRTVHAHLTSVYRKLGVANRAEAVRVAVERGLG